MISRSQRRCGKSCCVWMDPHVLFCADSGAPILKHPIFFLWTQSGKFCQFCMFWGCGLPSSAAIPQRPVPHFFSTSPYFGLKSSKMRILEANLTWPAGTFPLNSDKSACSCRLINFGGLLHPSTAAKVVTKEKHRPNRQQLSEKCPKILFSAPPDGF